MHLQTFRIRNFRRLKNVQVDLDSDTTIFVGSNNSGKTSATHVFQAFLGSPGERFSVHDFSADCWSVFDRIGSGQASDEERLPSIGLDLWFEVQDCDIHRVISILPSLDWKDAPVGIRLEFAAKDTATLLATFREAKDNASQFAVVAKDGQQAFHPWPISLTDYLKKRLSEEYKIFYYVLDHKQFDSDFQENETYHPVELGHGTQSGASLLSSLLRVDFLTAQRHLSDSDSQGRAEDLSKRMGRFYKRNLEKHDDDFKTVAALANSESHLNDHLSRAFESTLESLNKLGYPGFADPHLVIKSALDPESILTKHASLHYALNPPKKGETSEQLLTLPDRYNGLGFKNLIYMVIEILDYHKRWAEEEVDRPPLHLIVIEEPEAHLHAQLQQVFINRIRAILPRESPEFLSQLVITTHSPHIIYGSSFKPIRYFRRSARTAPSPYSEVLNLSKFYASEKKCRDFLLQYMKLTHCDLFFADAAVLVEGNVERLLLPLMIEKVAPQLQSSYLSILELGGAFAHLFKTLVHFLGLTTLVITDLDSVSPRPKKKGTDNQEESAADDADDADDAEGDEDEDEDEVDTDDGKPKKGTCMTDLVNAVSSNQTLVQWLPRMKLIEDLLNADHESKSPAPTILEPAPVCVAYQTRQSVTWKGETRAYAGRTFEDAFAFRNLEWCQAIEQKRLGLRVVTKKNAFSLPEIIQKIHDRVNVRKFGKTKLALGIIMADKNEWNVPQYIVDGLEWLAQQVSPNTEEASTAAANVEGAAKE